VPADVGEVTARGRSEEVTVSAKPSTGPIGALCRELTDTTTGYAVACLYAADRTTILRPRSALTLRQSASC
jgi:thymidylate kinase